VYAFWSKKAAAEKSSQPLVAAAELCCGCLKSIRLIFIYIALYKANYILIVI